jgi:hypothetical protein
VDFSCFSIVAGEDSPNIRLAAGMRRPPLPEMRFAEGIRARSDLSVDWCIAARRDLRSEVPGGQMLMHKLSHQFTNHKMQVHNHQMAGRHRPAAQVATQFLKRPRRSSRD